jgi:putative membrane protein
MIVKALVLLVVVAFGILLAVFNPGTVTVDFLVARAEIPLAWLIAGSLAAGALFGAVIIGAGLVRWRHRARLCQREAEVAREELANLRSLPLNSP